MYHAAGRLPHLLSPRAYSDADQYAHEQARIFRHAWRFVGTLDEIGRHGDFLTRTVGGRPLLLRNLKGEIRAFSNVCAHRHCLLKRERHGQVLELQCPYHGWRYNDAGLVKESRGQEHFRAEGAGRPALVRYRTALCGRLVFVRLDEPGPSLKVFLGDLYELLAERFGDDWRQSLAMDLDWPVNWKAPLEISLEGYHGPMVHPGTFGTDPTEERTTHALTPAWTSFSTALTGASIGSLPRRLYLRLQASLPGLLGETPAREYRHIHVFPNLTFAFTDGVSYVQTMEPAAPDRTHSLVRQFGLRRRRWPAWKRAAAAAWARVDAAAARRIVGEDAALYPAIQAGLNGSPHAGMLGRNEERVHAFQHWLVETLKDEAPRS